jgi:ribose 5-phosphate isomerase B
MKLGIAADHGGFELKGIIIPLLQSAGHTIVDYGADALNNGDDYPDFVVPMARAVASGDIDRGIAICGSGVGAAIAANKVPGVRAALIHDHFSAHQGVEDDNMNVICLGGRVTGYAMAYELIDTFLKARYSGGERFERRLTKVRKLENEK